MLYVVRIAATCLAVKSQSPKGIFHENACREGKNGVLCVMLPGAAPTSLNAAKIPSSTMEDKGRETRSQVRRVEMSHDVWTEQ